MTAQEIFDRVYVHLLTQNAKSYLSNDSRFCAYRGAGGRKCAVGCWIEDSEYDPFFEKQPVSYLLSSKTSPLAHLKKHEDLLQQLQYVHDAYVAEEWSDQLRAVAADFGLAIPEMP